MSWQTDAASKFKIHGLPPRRAAFVLAYLSDPKRNVLQASLKAGYTNAQYKLLKDPDVAEAIRIHLSRMSEQFEISVDSIVRELAKLGFANMGDFLARDENGKPLPRLDLSNLKPEQLAALESIQYEEDVVVSDGEDGVEEIAIKTRKVKFKLHDKKGALVDLLRQLGGQFEKDKANDGAPVKVVVEGGLPTGSAPPADIVAAAAARKAKK